MSQSSSELELVSDKDDRKMRSDSKSIQTEEAWGLMRKAVKCREVNVQTDIGCNHGLFFIAD